MVSPGVPRLEGVCPPGGRKVRHRMDTGGVTLLSWNSSLHTHLPRCWSPVTCHLSRFTCHLELVLPSSLYGFSVFLESLHLAGGPCHQEYLQFGEYSAAPACR